MSNFQVGSVIVTSTRGKWKVVDCSRSLVQVEEESGNTCWIPRQDLPDEISGKNKDEEPRHELQRASGRKRSRGSRPLQEADALDDSEE